MADDSRVVIVTGAAQGIGLACAERFARDGEIVVLVDINEEEGIKAASSIVDEGHQAQFMTCDVGERLDIRNVIAATLEAHGHIDVLINNAGIVTGSSFLELTEEDFDRVLRVNLKGSFLMGQAAARQMVAQVEAGGVPGTIVNMSSVNAVLALADHVPYTVSKGGIAQLSKAMSLALAPYGIRVNAIGPGSINTQILATVAGNEEARRKILSRTPLGRIGEPSEVAAVAAFLASQEASYITGQTIYPDGGRLPLNYTVPVIV
jgi:glucose 1-dehydrogenase